MHEHSLNFLKHLLTTPGPASAEGVVARVWREEARTFADEVSADVNGNSYAVLHGNGPRILLTGHIDEIGLMVSYSDDDGFLYFQAIGGWDAQVLVGQRVRLQGPAGEVIGVVGKKPIHLIKGDERTVASKIESLWLDIGAESRDEALERVPIGTVGVLDAPLYEFPHGRIVSRAVDNRIGAFIVLEALRLLAHPEAGAQRPPAHVVAVATTQEEITLAGARTAAFRVDPQIALVVDVTFATDHPEANKRQDGDVQLGGGPVLSQGGANSPLVLERLRTLAQQHDIPYAMQITPRHTGTDADAVYMVRSGIATGVVSIPNRYMHSPNEMIALRDVEQAARLIAAFVCSVQSADEFTPM